MNCAGSRCVTLARPSWESNQHLVVRRGGEATMVERVRVFVSYKKVVSRHVKGRTVHEANTEASLLAHILNESSQYEVWVDQDETEAGMEWETEIFTRLVASDAVLLLVGPGTSQSEWVKREIALANALGIS